MAPSELIRGINKKTNDWLIRNRLQLPTRFADSLVSTNRIPQKSNTVNNNSMQKTKKNTLPTSKNNKAPKYSIAGEKEMENAIQYDLNNIELEKMYNRAKSLHLNGVDKETIRKQTHAIYN